MRDTTPTAVGLGVMLALGWLAWLGARVGRHGERYRRARADLAANRAGRATLRDMLWNAGAKVAGAWIVLVLVLVAAGALACLGSR